MKQNPGLFTSFFRYNIVAGIATAVDFSILVLLTEVFGLWYLFSAVFGAVAGGITAFIFERNWTFMKTNGRLSVQAFRYLLIWVVSILLNVAGIYLFVDCLGLQYIFSKMIVAIVVGIVFNFMTHKYFIFR